MTQLERATTRLPIILVRASLNFSGRKVWNEVSEQRECRKICLPTRRKIVGFSYHLPVIFRFNAPSLTVRWVLTSTMVLPKKGINVEMWSHGARGPIQLSLVLTPCSLSLAAFKEFINSPRSPLISPMLQKVLNSALSSTPVSIQGASYGCCAAGA